MCMCICVWLFICGISRIFSIVVFFYFIFFYSSLYDFLAVDVEQLFAPSLLLILKAATQITFL